MPRLAHTIFSLILASTLLTACSKPPPPPSAEVVRPVKTFLIETAGTGGIRSFPARIDAGRKAEMSFRVSGKVAKLSVKEGDRVDKDQVVASLDPTDYRIKYNDRKANFDKTEKNFKRAQELVKKGNISKMDFDRLEADYKSATSALESAQQDLNYTKLTAPFSGNIAKRHIQAFEEVQAKQIIFDLQDLTQLEVKFDVPENLLRGIQGVNDRDAVRDRKPIPTFVSFSDNPEERYRLKFREVSTKADANTQTFEVTYTMEEIDGVTILPGMTANVTADLSSLNSEDVIHTVPSSAIVGDYKLDPTAWVVDEESMTVNPQPVKVGRLLGDRIQVLEGLEEGDRIVTAGTPFLIDGMKVTIMPDREQATPRPDDLKYQ
ncbi:MAG: efflux RND transporter periplasmic adaptor subunit [Candidatus Thiodiazotropha sp. (ex Monitilora ramsayi)]|nr:efflux RND transporter periplasmic adaptor subunit [Candidatus Thiodiazotropha sp. (ex Monitilora ramsayi)]